MSAMASQITTLAIVYSSVYSNADERKHQSSASLAFVGGIHRWWIPCTKGQKRGNFSIWWRHHEVFLWYDPISRTALMIIGQCCLANHFGAFTTMVYGSTKYPVQLKCNTPICHSKDTAIHIRVSKVLDHTFKISATSPRHEKIIIAPRNQQLRVKEQRFLIIIFSVYGQDIMCGNSKATIFAIHSKMYISFRYENVILRKGFWEWSLGFIFRINFILLKIEMLSDHQNTMHMNKVLFAFSIYQKNVYSSFSPDTSRRCVCQETEIRQWYMNSNEKQPWKETIPYSLKACFQDRTEWKKCKWCALYVKNAVLDIPGKRLWIAIS